MDRQLVAFLVFFLATSTPTAGVADRPPNVLWIAVDDLWPNIGSYGFTHVKTPHIDRLAREGMLFTRAYAQMALCWPSRNMVFSGCRLDTLKLRSGEHTFRATRPGIVALPQLFKNQEGSVSLPMLNVPSGTQIISRFKSPAVSV